MNKVTVPINSFNAGEVSPLTDARVDLTKYASGCRKMENAFPLVEGGAKKMPGTYYIEPSGNATGKSRLAPFSFSTDQSYILEFSDKQVRVFTDEGLLQGGTVPTAAVDYNPVTAYSAGRTVKVGDYWSFSFQGGKSFYISAPYGEAIPNLPIKVWLIFAHGDTLEIKPYWNDGGIEIWLAYDTASKNTAPLIQAGIRALGTLKGFDLSNIVVTPNAAYYAEPAYGESQFFDAKNATSNKQAYLALQANQYCYFPPVEDDYWVSTFIGGEGGSGSGEGTTPPTATSDYDPATSYAANDTVNVGNWWKAYFDDDKSFFIAGPAGIVFDGFFGQSLDFEARIDPTHGDTLTVSAALIHITANTGYVMVTINLASTTASKNAADLIQAAIRALGTVNNLDLSAFTCTPDAAYYAAPEAGTTDIAYMSYDLDFPHAYQAVQANQYCHFPPSDTEYWSPTVIASGGGEGEGGGEEEEGSTTAVTLVTPYLEADLFDLDLSTQSADMLYVFHNNYPPMVIARHSATYWTISILEFTGTESVSNMGNQGIAKPIDDIELNVSYVLIKCNDHGFADGALVYINHCIGAYHLNKSLYTVDYIDEDSFYINENNAQDWPGYEGGGMVVEVVSRFDEEGEYPGCGTFFEQRLVLAGFLNHPERICGSVVGDYYNFISDPIEEDYAIQFDLVSQKVDPVVWIVSQNKLALGTVGGIWIVSGANNQPLSQFSVDSKRQITNGASKIAPQIVNDDLIWFDRVARVGRLLQYEFGADKWIAPDLTRIARHITSGSTAALSGIKQTAYQQFPYPILWAIRNDGQIIGMTYESQEQIYAWFRIVTDGKCESIAVVPRQNDEDRVWVVVDRS
jgi:hypothetical protein